MIWNCITFLIITEFTLFYNHFCHGDDSMCRQLESDKTCTQTCSQLTPRIEGERDTFQCEIGGKNSVDDFTKENLEAFTPDALKIFQAPKMLGVEYYHKIFDSDQVHSLKITFQLPKGVSKQSDNSWQFPKAVLMKFTSVSEMEYKDEFYFNCPKERIFIFRNYAPKYAHDVENPRNLTYDCIVGLDGSMIKAAYLVTLTTVHGHSVVYVVMVNIQARDNYEPWTPVIITNFNEMERSIYAVIEIPPVNYKIDDVQLFRENELLKKQTLEGNQGNGNSTTFANITRGRYFIMVSSSCKKDPCNKTTQTKSLMIDASHLPDEYYSLDGTLSTMKISAMIMGCLVAVMVLLALMYFMQNKKRNTNHNSSDVKPMGIIMHPFTNNDAICKVIKYFEDFLICDCDCSLATSKGKETCLPEPQKYGNISNNTVFAIVFCNCDPHAQINDYYYNTVNEVWKKRKQHNDIRIIIVTVSLPHKANCMQEIIEDLTDTRNGERTDKLILEHDVEKLYCKIHGTTEEKHFNSSLHKDLLESIKGLQEDEPIKETKLPFPPEFGAQLLKINEFLNDTEAITACANSTSQHKQAEIYSERENIPHAVYVPSSPCQSNKINKDNCMAVHMADMYHFNTDNEFSSQAEHFVKKSVLANDSQGSLPAHTERHTCFQTAQHIYRDNEQHSHIVDGHCNSGYSYGHNWLSEVMKMNTDMDYHDDYSHNDKHHMNAANHTQHHMDTTRNVAHCFPSITCNGSYVQPLSEHSIIQHNGSSPKVICLTEQIAQSNIHQTLCSNEHTVQTNKHQHITHKNNPNVKVDYQFDAMDPLLSDLEEYYDDSIYQLNDNCQSTDSHIRSTHSLPAQLDRISYGHNGAHDCFQCFNPIPPLGSDESVPESLVDAMAKINSM